MVLSHYQHYICPFALQKGYGEQDRVSVQVDDFFRRSLETKLIEAILKYQVPNN
ncbi:helix-turn-helix domain-containing protein [Enterococcus faecalis]|uniref:helix-turn-helix domain-containing protein n=1 Tax=Enterococcus faecalis TaxID=1351 RepID=UPI0021DF8064|nr:helix-turn-helix domain-containing protein [Enterococcus faecalis]MCU9758973.1 helix-turn-helix domain-containing protein [Enterococcus faecalis]